MSWFLRAIEEEDGSWRCQSGRTVFDHHSVLDDAIAHLTCLASASDELFVHRIDGTVERMHPPGD